MKDKIFDWRTLKLKIRKVNVSKVNKNKITKYFTNLNSSLHDFLAISHISHAEFTEFFM